MRIEMSVENDDAENGRRSVYSYSIELPDKTSMENVEAHAASVMRILDKQSRENEDDDNDSGDAWKKPTTPA